MKITVKMLVENQPVPNENFTGSYLRAAVNLGWEFPGAKIDEIKDTITADHTVIEDAIESLVNFTWENVGHGDGVDGEDLMEILGRPHLRTVDPDCWSREADIDKIIADALAADRQAKIEAIINEAWETDSCVQAMEENWCEEMPLPVFADLLEECGVMDLAGRIRELLAV